MCLSFSSSLSETNDAVSIVTGPSYELTTELQLSARSWVLQTNAGKCAPKGPCELVYISALVLLWTQIINITR